MFCVYDFCPYVTSKLFDNRTMIFWLNFLEHVIDNFQSQGYNFHHIAELNFITIANKTDMSYDFYIRHNKHAVEWKIIAKINKNKSVINKLGRNWRHPLIIEYSRIPFND